MAEFDLLFELSVLGQHILLILNIGKQFYGITTIYQRYPQSNLISPNKQAHPISSEGTSFYSIYTASDHIFRTQHIFHDDVAHVPFPLNAVR